MQLVIIYKAEMSKDQSKVFDLDSGNLLPVAMNIRELSPDSEVIIAGDNDPPTKEYPEDIGKTKARGQRTRNSSHRKKSAR